jgi:hypothetical protein
MTWFLGRMFINPATAPDFSAPVLAARSICCNALADVKEAREG